MNDVYSSDDMMASSARQIPFDVKDLENQRNPSNSFRSTDGTLKYLTETIGKTDTTSKDSNFGVIPTNRKISHTFSGDGIEVNSFLNDDFPYRFLYESSTSSADDESIYTDEIIGVQNWGFVDGKLLPSDLYIGGELVSRYYDESVVSEAHLLYCSSSLSPEFASSEINTSLFSSMLEEVIFSQISESSYFVDDINDYE